MNLNEYPSKRKFGSEPINQGISPEPKGDYSPKSHTAPLIFCVHKHAASHLHYDLRLQFQDALKSWAIPKGPTLNPAKRRLAILVENHPIEYDDFEGLIPERHYGSRRLIDLVFKFS